MATQYFKRNLPLNLYRRKKILLVCFLLPPKRDKNVWHLQAISSIWRPLSSWGPLDFLSTCLGNDSFMFKRWKGKSKNEWPNFSVYEWLIGRCYSPINDWWGCSFTNLLRTREGWILELVKMVGVGIKTPSWGGKQMLSLDNRWTVTDTIYYLHTSQCTLEKIKLLADPERFWISIGLTKKFIWGFSITS